MRKRDLYLVVGIVIVAVIGILVVLMNQKEGKQVVITVDGEVYEEVSLEEEKTIEVDTEHGKNVVRIENGSVFMEEADCPDQICVEHKTISKSGETIVCLPHKVVVEVKADNSEKEIDSIVQ